MFCHLSNYILCSWNHRFKLTRFRSHYNVRQINLLQQIECKLFILWLRFCRLVFMMGIYNMLRLTFWFYDLQSFVFYLFIYLFLHSHCSHSSCSQLKTAADLLSRTSMSQYTQTKSASSWCTRWSVKLLKRYKCPTEVGEKLSSEQREDTQL